MSVLFLQLESKGLTDSNTLGVDQVVESGLDQFRKMVRQMLMADVVQVVVVGVLGHPSVEVRPGQDILKDCQHNRRRLTHDSTNQSISLVLDGLDRGLSQEVVVKHVGGQV